MLLSLSLPLISSLHSQPPRSSSGSGTWHGCHCTGLARSLYPSPPPCPEVSFVGQRKWMAWDDWLNSHPLLGPETGVTLPAPEPGWGRRLCHSGSAWSHCQEPGPSALPPGSPAQFLGLSSTTFPAIVLERTEPPIWPCPCSCVPPVTLSAPPKRGHIQPFSCPSQTLQVGRVVKGGFPEGLSWDLVFPEA